LYVRIPAEVKAEISVKGNKRSFRRKCSGTKILSPSEFLTAFGLEKKVK
jgi:hypothetical protein